MCPTQSDPGVIDSRERALGVKTLAGIQASIDKLAPAYAEALKMAETFDLPEGVKDLIDIINAYNPTLNPQYAVWAICKAQEQAKRILGPLDTIKKFNRLTERRAEVTSILARADAERGIGELATYLTDPSGRPLQ